MRSSTSPTSRTAAGSEAPSASSGRASRAAWRSGSWTRLPRLDARWSPRTTRAASCTSKRPRVSVMSTSGSLTCWSSSQSTWPDSYALSSVKISLVATPPAELPVDALAVAVATGQRLSGLALELDKALGGVLSDMITSAEFRGRIHEVLPVPTHGRSAPRRVILYGVGAANDLDGQRLRSAHHELIRASRTYGYKRIGLVRTEPPLGMDTLKAVVEGCVMGTFERRSRQTGAQPERREIDQLVLTGFGIGREHEVVAAQENGEPTNRAPESQNSPPNKLTPQALAQEAVN